jgi:hypothetical protein
MQVAAATVSRGRGPPTGRIVTRQSRYIEKADFCIGTEATSSDIRCLVALGGKADVMWCLANSVHDPKETSK